MPERERAPVHDGLVAPPKPLKAALRNALVEIREKGTLEHQHGELVHPEVIIAHQRQERLRHHAHPDDRSHPAWEQPYEAIPRR